MKVDEAINLAINNVIREGLTDVDLFNRPFEISMLKGKVREEVFTTVKASLKHNDFKSLGVSPLSHVLVPKKELFDFRKCALIQPLDEIKYLALVLHLASRIERARLPKSKKNVFSYRFNPNKSTGYIFDFDYNFTSFKNHVTKKSKSKNVNVVVSCDISNFYDRINLHRVECVLSSIKGIDTNIVSQLNELLLFWSNRDSYSLPVGSNASRVIAEAALIEVDNYLVSRGVDFCRFVDDYRLFAKDAATAHYWLSLLVDRLSKEGLFINNGKTEIKDVSTFGQKEDSNNVVTFPSQSSPEEWHSNQEEFQAKIIRGYSGLIPTKFRKLTKTEETKLKELDPQTILDQIKSSTIIDPKKYVQLIKACVANKSSTIFTEAVKQLTNFPQFIPFTLDAVSKSEDIFSDTEIEQISQLLEQTWLDGSKTPEFILVFTVRFFGQGKFKNKQILFDYFRRLKRNEGTYVGRAVLEQLESMVDRGEVLEIRDYFARADLWEKRQIARIVNMHLTAGEKRPFFKNVLSTNNDILLKHIKTGS